MPDIKLCIESPDGERYECEISASTRLSTLAADFFEARGWPMQDSQGRGQRAVVELFDPERPDRTKRLRGEDTVGETVWDGAVLRIFPESIAGAVDERERIRALVADHEDMKELVEWNTHIQFEANLDYAPFIYTVTMDYDSFWALAQDGHTPRISNDHQVKITLGADYPRRAPRVQWLTDIFHPNIDPNTGAVCLGALMERYLPGMGLVRLVTMLAEMIQWRNFDLTSSLNATAAAWAANTAHWHYITEIGGSTLQDPIQKLLGILEKSQRESITFKRVA